MRNVWHSFYPILWNISGMYFKYLFTRQLDVQATAQTSSINYIWSTQWRERHITQLIASLDQPWDRHTKTGTTYDCCDHPEIGTLRRTHCHVDRMPLPMLLVTPSTSVPILYEECHGYDDVTATSAVFTSHPVSSWSQWSLTQFSELIATDSWRHQSQVTLLLKVAVSQ